MGFGGILARRLGKQRWVLSEISGVIRKTKMGV